MKRGRKPMSVAAKRAHEEWTLDVISRFCCEGQALFSHQCQGPMDAAHAIPKRFLKDATLGWEEADALAVIFDLRNGLSLCRAAHNRLDGPWNSVTFEQLPDSVVSFATEHGFLWKLEKLYPRDVEEAA